MRILAIETSCDETSAAIISDTKEILSNLVVTQLAEHKPYGGVVPEIAARSHIDNLDIIIRQALQQANVTFKDLDAIAATGGPGLIGGLIVGVMTAKAIAAATRKPFIAVNHLEGHALTVRLTHNIDFPYLLLLISGGHCQLLIVEQLGQYKKLGATIDDALGEAFDKVAKMLRLGYPGGPIIEKKATLGNNSRFHFPRSMVGKEGYDFSFSGLKTAVKRQIDNMPTINETDIADISASFQQTIGDILKDRLAKAMSYFKDHYPSAKNVVIAGGVAANQFIRSELQALAAEYNLSVTAPPLALCTDNAAMIGWAAIERMQAGFTDDISFTPKAIWPLC